MKLYPLHVKVNLKVLCACPGVLIVCHCLHVQVNMPLDSFESPLTLAACGGHLELAALLLSRGANLAEVNDEG